MKTAETAILPLTDEVKKFYVYELRLEDGTPFYVGKGQGDRRFKHMLAAKRGEQTHVYRKIRSLWAEGKDFVGVAVFYTDNETDALAEEIRLIAQYGRDNLTNLTDGGDGASGYQWTDEAKRKFSIAKTGSKHSPETLEKLKVVRNQRDPMRQETREKMRIASTGRAYSEASREKMRQAAMGNNPSKATREKMRQAKLGKVIPPERRAKMLKASHANRKLKVTDTQIVEILLARQQGENQRVVAKRYGISRSYVHLLTSGVERGAKAFALIQIGDKPLSVCPVSLQGPAIVQPTAETFLGPCSDGVGCGE